MRVCTRLTGLNESAADRTERIRGRYGTNGSRPI